MAEKIIDNPSLLPSNLAFELSGNTITAISGHPIAGSGGGTQSDYVYYPDFDETTGNIEFKLGSIDNPPSPIGGWHISGADGARGPQGEPGVNGKTPIFQIDPENAHWEWKYTDDEYWTDTHVVASGAVGPKGDKGADGISPTVSTSVIEGGNRVTFTYGAGSSTYIDVMSGTPGVKGADGISPTVSTETIAGGNRVTFTYDTPSKTKYIDVMSGAPGAPGVEGFSPTISTTPITDDPEHPQGGTKVTVIDSTGTEEFKIWNGVNGQGATVNLKDGDGIHITQSSNDYTIGVSANYSAMAVTWVQDQHYLTNIPNDYALKSDVEAASANALSEAESWVVTEGYLKAVPDSYATKAYANEASANALSEAESWVGQCGFITKDVNDLTYYYKKTETSSTSELSTEFANKVNKPDTSLTDKYLVLRTDTNGAASGWCDFNDKIYSKTESDGRYMQNITDSTLSGNGTTNNPLGIDTTNMAASKQYAFTTTGWAEVSVPTIPDITANNGLSATGHTVGISTTNIDANKQYAWTTNGWAEVDGYLPTSGGTVSGELIVSAARNTFDDNYIKCINDGNTGYSRFGVGSWGGAVIKAVDGSNNPVQVNIRYNANNNELIQVQKSNADVGYLIPAKIEQAGWSPSTDDKILHIVLES